MKTLAEKIAVMQAAADGKRIQLLLDTPDTWADAPCPSWNWLECDYRIKPAPKRVPLTREDWEGPVWWIRLTTEQRVAAILPEGVLAYIHGAPLAYLWTFSELSSANWQRSRDLKTWEPCSKEEA